MFTGELAVLGHMSSFTEIRNFLNRLGKHAQAIIGRAQRQLDGDRHLLVEGHAGKGDALSPADLDAPAARGIGKGLGRVKIAMPELVLAGLLVENLAVKMTDKILS